MEMKSTSETRGDAVWLVTRAELVLFLLVFCAHLSRRSPSPHLNMCRIERKRENVDFCFLKRNET